MVSAIIVAAGRGTRMGPNTDKLFIRANGLPIIAHTWRTFDQLEAISEIVVVVREGTADAFSSVATELKFAKPFRLVAGGAERQDSVWNGLEALSPKAEIVAIQDAARPCTRQQLICATIDAARSTGAAVAAQQVTDTIKESTNGWLVIRTIDRSRLWSVQTPQTFRVEMIRRALAEVRRRGLHVTDDAAACEAIGQPVQLVPSPDPNPKLTKPEDVAYIEFFLKSKGEM